MLLAFQLLFHIIHPFTSKILEMLLLLQLNLVSELLPLLSQLLTNLSEAFFSCLEGTVLNAKSIRS